MGRRLLLWGDAGSVTGFSRVHHSIGERLVDKYGWDIHVLAINHRGDYWPTNLKLYRPTVWSQNDIFGLSRMVEMLKRVEPDVVWLTHDPHLLLQVLFDNQYDTTRILLQYRPLLTYVPCDGTNLPPAWTTILPSVSQVVAMSKWGQSQYKDSKLVYHGVDTDLFWPVSDKRPIYIEGRDEPLRSKRECKRAFGYDEDGFLILRVDKNSGRKDFAATYKALVPVMLAHPDIQVHFHCSEKNDSHGVNLPTLFSRSPEVRRERWFTPADYETFNGWPQSHMNALYNAADLFVTTSRGEGFGLTIAESLAVGVPVVAQNVSAIPEVVGPGGLLIEPQRLLTVPSGEDVWLADIPAFSEAIERVYLSAGLRRDLSEAGREHIQNFSWDVAADRFNEYLSALADRGTGTEAEDPAPND